MPESLDPEGRSTLTLAEIADRYDVSRSTIHTYRRRGIFPPPVPSAGTTRLRYDAREVAAFFEAHPKRPGKRTDLERKRDEE